MRRARADDRTDERKGEAERIVHQANWGPGRVRIRARSDGWGGRRADGVKCGAKVA